jgi:ABC-type glycerol-3-phosphate transport system substrate-binding protein
MGRIAPAEKEQTRAASLVRTLPSLTKPAGPGEVSQFAFDPFFGSGGTQRWLVPFWQLGGEFHNAEGTKVTIANERGIQALEWCNWPPGIE